MRVVFMGTPAFAATILDDLAEQHDVAAVYTRPDAVRGRGKRLEPSPVKAAAERRGLRVLTPRTLRDEAAQRELASFAPDVICVAAYGAILPKEVLDIPRFGCLNVHASLLPRWRGSEKASYPDFEKLDELFGSSRASAVFSDGVSFGSSEQFGFVHFHAVFFGQRFDDFEIFFFIRFLEGDGQSEAG